jgi:membrane protease YdiL (CAAX protease family)
VAKIRTPADRVSIPLLMLFQVAALAVRELVRLKLTETGINSEVARHCSTLIGFGVLGVLIWPLLRGRTTAALGMLRKPRSWWPLVACSLGIGLLLRLGSWAFLVAQRSFDVFGSGNTPQAIGPLLSWTCPPMSDVLSGVAVMAILTPMIEEFINRGLILDSLKNYARLIQIVASALLFAVLHVLDNIPNAFVFGVIAAVQMQNCQTLWGPLISHATYNLLATLDQHCLMVFWVPQTTSTTRGAAIILLGITLYLVAIMLAQYGSAGGHNAPGTRSR